MKITRLTFAALFFLSFKVFAQVSFQLAAAIDMPNTPQELAKGDFNNDGLPDLVSANFNALADKQVTILLNTGTGTFSGTNVRSFPASTNVLDVATGDFNEDGNLDVVVCSQPNDNFSLLLGDGTGNLNAPLNFDAGDTPQGIAVGDMNKDNNLDVLVSNRGVGEDLRIFLGTGTGNFAAPAVIVIDNIFDVTVADFNNDTNPDFAIYAANAIQVWLGDGSGTDYTLDHTSTAVGTSDDVDAVDLDNDGVMDIITNRAYIMNNGAGTFASPVLLEMPGEETGVGDFNNDGNPDIAQTDYNAHYANIRIYLGDGAGVFTLLAKFETDVYSWGIQALDVNNDANVDIVGVGTDGSLRKANILLGDGNGYFNSVHKYPTTTDPRDMVKGDFNEDGIIDVALCHSISSNNVSVYLGQGQGKFTKASGTYDAGSFPYQIIALDYNKDTHLDLVTFNMTSSSSSITVFTGDGTGQFSASSDIAIATNFGRITVADFDNDTNIDLVVSGGTAKVIYLLTGTGSGFNAPATIPVTEDIYEIKAGDFDNNGNQDIAAIFHNANKFLVLFGDGAGDFTEGIQYNALRDLIDIYDFNDDTHPDVIAYVGNTTGVDIFINDGNGNFTGSVFSEAHSQLGLGYADMDADGIEDLITGGQTSNSSSAGLHRIYKGLGAGLFDTSVIYEKNYSGGNRLLMHDVNGDGRQDIITTSFNMYEDYLAVMINNTPEACVPPTVNTLSPDAAICLGFPATFSVTAAGTAPYTYQWKKNTVNIDGATNSSHTIAAVSAADEASYTVEITNACGTVTSEGIALVVNLVSPPDASAVSRCDAGVVTLTASGSTNGNYRWYDVASGGSPMPGEVNDAYTTPFLSTTTSYFVAINDGSCESTRTMVNAIINSVPSINTLSPDMTVCSGTPVDFSVSASGGALGYQWKKNTGNVSGETNALISFPATNVSDGGTYTVEVTNTCGSVISNDIVLIVNASPEAPVTVGASRCDAGSLSLNSTGSNNGNYRWYDVAAGGTPIPGEFNETFTTPALAVTTAYYVSIHNGVCESPRTEAIAVIQTPPAKPAITSNITPVDGTVTICGNTFAVLEAPSGFVAYSWSDGSSSQVVTVSSEGVYSVQVIDANNCSSISSDPINVVVDPAICNTAPAIAVPLTIVQVDGVIVINLLELVSDAEDNIDLTTLKIISSPQSGATAVIDESYNLSLNYTGVAFVGTDNLIIEVCDQLGSCTQAQLSVEVTGEIEIFNAMSPNGDNLNDFFLIRHIDLFDETRNNHVTIFNRWGDIVFETDNYNNTTNVFHGSSHNGKALPSGTYFYKIVFDGDRKLQTGFLTLKR